MKKLFLFATVACAAWSVGVQNTFSQGNNYNRYPQENVTGIDNDAIYVPESWELGLDSLLNSWQVRHYTQKMRNDGYRETRPISDAVYMERLSKLNTVIELPYNGIVRNCIDMYVDKRRNMVEYMLGLENFYFPMIEEALDKNGLPDELKYLTIVESALNPTAFSHAGASGLWQFIHSTGKAYGMEINSLVDERRDPVKSTYAACQYFKNMYNIFGDWTLVIASYNCGSGNVQKAIRRAGGITDYWKIYPYLPKETRSYVPFFIAVNYVMNYYAQHQLYPVKTTLPPATDTVIVNQTLHFDQISAILGIEKDQLRYLNPQYKRDVIPGDRPRPLKLPTLQAYAFIEMQDTIAKYRVNELFTNRTLVTDIGASDNAKIIHRVRKGETLATVASRYGVSMSNLRRWNGLRSNKVARGKALTIYVDNGGHSYASNRSSSSSSSPSITASPSSSRSNSNTSDRVTAQHKKQVGTSTPYQRYKVKSGDSFYSIARKYPGYTHLDIMKMNNMSKNSLKIGQYIIVPKV
ncbi:MAG: transglycosylase SLT domain-containing protein [Dysgonamonadaceae bacterium]|jgi:membrane-bound lytic murein transglycosylase D|nr:transglycosylase SLT domain-containing protein [Dysgonamonadaceae bacterium]